MELSKGIKEFIEECIKEKDCVTVEGSTQRMWTTEEIDYINNQLKEYGYAVNCFPCETCSENSDGKYPFHIERITLM